MQRPRRSLTPQKQASKKMAIPRIKPRPQVKVERKKEWTKKVARQPLQMGQRKSLLRKRKRAQSTRKP
jgi:hypothetical protein